MISQIQDELSWLEKMKMLITRQYVEERERTIRYIVK